MAVIDVSALTMNPEEVREANKIIFEKLFTSPTLEDIHVVETGIVMKTQIVLAQRIDKLLGKLSVGCTPNSEGGFTMSQKYWDPVTEDFRLTHCQKDLPALLKLFKKAQKMNPDFYDVVDSEELGIVIAAIEAAMMESIIIKIWFADKTAKLIADGGVFNAAIDLAKINTFDGLFKQIFADVPSSASNYVNIAKNAGASYAAQALADDEALGIFKKMFNKADKRLSKDSNAELLVTASLFDNFVDTLENKTITNGFLERAEDGSTNIRYRGVPVKMMDIWDRTIDQYQDNGTKLNLPHRAVLTIKENIPVGTLSTEDFQSLDVFYDKTQKINIMDAVYTIDAKHLENYLTVAAY
jgi:hypothetical protein